MRALKTDNYSVSFEIIWLSQTVFLKNHEYLIKWEGWPLECCAWEPSSHLNEDLIT